MKNWIEARNINISNDRIEVMPDSSSFSPDRCALLLVGAEDVGAAEDEQRQQAQRREAQHAAPAEHQSVSLVTLFIL